MVIPPKELSWILSPTKKHTEYKSYRMLTKGKRYKRPPESVILDVAKYLGFKDENKIRGLIEPLYDKSSKIALCSYRNSAMSLYKTTWLIYDNLKNPEILNKLRLRRKNLHAIFETSIQLLNKHRSFPVVDNHEFFKEFSTKDFDTLLHEGIFKRKESEVRKLLKKCRIVGYGQYSQNLLSAIVDYSDETIMEKDAHVLLNKLYYHGTESVLLNRLYSLFDQRDPMFSRDIGIDIISLYKKLKKPVTKSDMEFILKKRLGFFVNKGENLENLIDEQVDEDYSLSNLMHQK